VADGDKSGDQGNQDQGRTYDAAYVKRITDEAAGYRRELDELKGKVGDFETKEADRAREADEAKGNYETAKAGYVQTIGERDKAITDLKAAHTKELNALQRSRLIDRAEIVAARFGMHDPGDIAKYIDVKDLKLDDDASFLAGIEERVTALKESKQFLFKGEGGSSNGNGERAGASPGGGNGSRGGGGIDLSAYDPATRAKLEAVIAV
jgi:uncharacterized membrane protein YgcG